MQPSSAPTSALATALPHLQPRNEALRLMLFAIRRTGANGLTDAAVAHAFITAFGNHFRRPLVLLRALMAESSTAAARPITIAPWCCRRMTADERVLLDVLGSATTKPERAQLLLADLLGRREAESVFATACLLAIAFAESGLPLSPST